MNLYVHSPIRLQSVVLNYLSTGTTFTFYLSLYRVLSKLAMLAIVLSGEHDPLKHKRLSSEGKSKAFPPISDTSFCCAMNVNIKRHVCERTRK
jgi:hypothetical protein